MRKNNNFEDTSIIVLTIILSIIFAFAINIIAGYYIDGVKTPITTEEYIYPENECTYNLEGNIIRIEAPTMSSPFVEIEDAYTTYIDPEEEIEITEIIEETEEIIIEEPDTIIEEVPEIIEEEPIETVNNRDNYTKYTVKSGDNYYNISRYLYGNATYFKALEKYNDKTMLYPGDVLIIPPVDDEEFQKLCNNINEEFKASIDDFADSLKGTVVKAGTNGDFKYGKRMNPAIDITIPSTDDMKNYTGEVDTSNYTLVGSWFITGYTPGCEHCCGSTEGITASGVKAICGYTVATGKSLPFGTTIYVEGYGYYVVEDRGPRDGIIDIASPNHEACGPVTKRGVNVYIVPNE